MNLSLKKNILKIFFLCLIAVSCADGAGEAVLKGWSVLLTPAETIDAAKDAKLWRPAAAPLLFNLPRHGKAVKSLWLRGEININGDPEKYYGLAAGRIRLADRIFINDKPAGSLALRQTNWHSTPRNYVLPEGILKSGKNEIYMQISYYDTTGDYRAGINGDVRLLGENAFAISSFLNNLIYNQLPFGIALMGIGFIIASFILYLWNRKEKLFLYFAGIILFNIVYSVISLPHYKFLNFELYHAVSLSLPVIAWIFLILSIQSIYRKYLSGYNRIIISVLIAGMSLNFIFYNTPYFPLVISVPAYLYLFIVAPYYAFIIYRLNSIEEAGVKKPDKYLIFAITTGLIMIGLIPIVDTRFYFSGNANAGFPTIFVPPAAFILFAVFIARESMKRQMEIDRLYDELDVTGSRNKELSITDTAEEKLNRIIDFIKENYTRDISREGLSAAVDLNSDYMSRLFKSYTGMKVNEYINKLRIEEAARRLESGDSKIIDIAFAVGFDNTISFNRTFKSIMKLTPSEYREMSKPL